MFSFGFLFIHYGLPVLGTVNIALAQQAVHGLVLAVLQSHYGTVSVVTLTASAQRLVPASATVQVVAPGPGPEQPWRGRD